MASRESKAKTDNLYAWAIVALFFSERIFLSLNPVNRPPKPASHGFVSVQCILYDPKPVEGRPSVKYAFSARHSHKFQRERESLFHRLTLWCLGERAAIFGLIRQRARTHARGMLATWNHTSPITRRTNTRRLRHIPRAASVKGYASVVYFPFAITVVCYVVLFSTVALNERLSLKNAHNCNLVPLSLKFMSIWLSLSVLVSIRFPVDWSVSGSVVGKNWIKEEVEVKFRTRLWRNRRNQWNEWVVCWLTLWQFVHLTMCLFLASTVIVCRMP